MRLRKSQLNMTIVNAIDPDAKVTLQNIADRLEIAHLEAAADRKRPEFEALQAAMPKLPKRSGVELPLISI